MGTKQMTSPLQALLKECYRRPHSLCSIRRNNYSTHTPTTPDAAPKNIAVLGGGITGLTSAYLLSKKLPTAKITVVESSDRLGGWLQSSEVEADQGRVLFEHGPRTLRPSGASGMATLDLIRRLGLEDDILITSKESPAAQNRYIYYPDHLVRMPGPGQSPGEILAPFLTEPLFRGFSSGAFKEFFRPPRILDLRDESVGSFLRRRFGEPLANIASAVFHGIYAGDIDTLSTRSLIPMFWHMERESGSIIRDVITRTSQRKRLLSKNDLDFLQSINSDWHDSDGMMLKGLDKFRSLLNASVYTFRAGIEQLSISLKEELERASNVSIQYNTKATATKYLGQESNHQIQLTTEKTEPSAKSRPNDNQPEIGSYDYIVSALPDLPHCNWDSDNYEEARFISRHDEALNTNFSPSVTVMVINLHFRTENLLPVSGFGYLLPRSLPFEQNPERALGVVFDSDTVLGQDSAPGTKLTVMMGGHWWDGWPSYPDEHEALKMARSVLERHMGIREAPDAWKVTLQKNCIPQYHVGHRERLEKMRDKLLKQFGGKFRVAGSAYTGVSVNDCVRSAYTVVDRIVDGKWGTGLEDLEENFVLGVIPKR